MSGESPFYIKDNARGAFKQLNIQRSHKLLLKRFIVVDLDFQNAAGFMGKTATNLDGQFMVYYLSHAMMFCAGALIEPHIVLTTASCVFGEDFKFPVYAGSHKFLLNAGAERTVENICLHRAYNHTNRCATDNVALLVLNMIFGFRHREPKTEYIMNRVRYGVSWESMQADHVDMKCRYYGWGSRRNGFLLPLLIQMQKMEAKLLEAKKCYEMWNTDNKFLCLNKPSCTNEKYGALCPDDLGSVLVCNGYVQGMMTSSLVDRPCGVGFVNMLPYTKFLTCAVDDSRDVIHDDTIDVDHHETTPSTKRVNIADDLDFEGRKSTPCADEECAPKVTIGVPTTIDKVDLIPGPINPTNPSRFVKRSRLRHSKHHFRF